jgi:hypothetical protein
VSGFSRTDGRSTRGAGRNRATLACDKAVRRLLAGYPCIRSH